MDICLAFSQARFKYLYLPNGIYRPEHGSEKSLLVRIPIKLSINARDSSMCAFLFVGTVGLPSRRSRIAYCASGARAPPRRMITF